MSGLENVEELVGAVAAKIGIAVHVLGDGAGGGAFGGGVMPCDGRIVQHKIVAVNAEVFAGFGIIDALIGVPGPFAAGIDLAGDAGNSRDLAQIDLADLEGLAGAVILVQHDVMRGAHIITDNVGLAGDNHVGGNVHYLFGQILVGNDDLNGGGEAVFGVAVSGGGDGVGDGGGTRAHTGNGAPAVYCGNVGVAGGPGLGIVIGVGGIHNGLELELEGGSQAIAFLREGEAFGVHGVAAEEHPVAVNGLRGIGIRGEGIVGTHDDGERVAVRLAAVGAAAGIHHVFEGLGHGVILILHLVPEDALDRVVAHEGDGLGIAVNDARARTQQRIAGGAVAVHVHALADGHPEDAVGQGAGDMVLDVAAVDIGFGARVDSPTVGVILRGDARVGGQAQIGRRAGLGAVGVEYDYAVIGAGGGDGGAGRAGGLEYGHGAAGGVGNGLSFQPVLVGEAGIMAVIGADEQHVHVDGPVLGRAGDHLDGLNVRGGFEVPALPGDVIIAAGHAVDGEEEALGGNAGEAALVNELVVQSGIVNCHNGLGPACAGSEHLSLDGLEILPNGVKQTELCVFGFGFDNTLRKRGGGDHGKHHNNSKRYTKETFDIHTITFLSVWLGIFYHSNSRLSRYINAYTP